MGEILRDLREKTGQCMPIDAQCKNGSLLKA